MPDDPRPSGARPTDPFAGPHTPDRDRVASPVSGKAVEFVETPTDPDSDPLLFEMWLAHDGHGPMLHVHPEQDEELEPLSGRLGVRIGSDTRVLTPGERVVVPADTPHRFWNAGDGRLHLRGGVWPGLRTEAFMRIVYGLPRDGEPATPSGMVLNPLRLSVLLEEYDDMLWLARVPPGLQRAGVRALAHLGRAAGYTNHYPEYLPDESGG